MFGRSFPLGRYYGVELRIDYSWFIIFFLIVSSFAFALLPELYPEFGSLAAIVFSILMGALFFLSVVAHELAHAVYANRHDLRVDRMTFFLFGGAAELQHEPQRSRTEFFMAFVGPLVSYLAAALFFGLYLLGWQFGLLYIEAGGLILAMINAAVGTFNLIPAYPLDGGRMFRAVVWRLTGSLRRGTKIATVFGRGFALLLVAYGAVSIFSGLFVNGVWLILLGSFLYHAASQSYTMTMLTYIYGDLRVIDFMDHYEGIEPRPTDIEPEATLLDALKLINKQPVLYVGYEDQPIGIVTRQHVRYFINRVKR